MATNPKQDGVVLATANSTGSTITSGTGVAVGAQLRVAVADIANGASGPAATEGVWTLPKKAGDTFTDGLQLYWDGTNGWLTSTASGASCNAGKAAGAAASGSTTADVKLNA